METISTISGILMMIALLCAVLALINPKIFRMKSRPKSFFGFILLAVIFLFVGTFTMQQSPEKGVQKEILEQYEVLMEQKHYEEALKVAQEADAIYSDYASEQAIKDSEKAIAKALKTQIELQSEGSTSVENTDDGQNQSQENSDTEDQAVNSYINQLLVQNQTYYDMAGVEPSIDYNQINTYYQPELIKVIMFKTKELDGYLGYRGEVNRKGEPDGNGVLFIKDDQIVAYGTFNNGQFEGGHVDELFNDYYDADFDVEEIDKDFFIPGDTYYATNDQITGGVYVRINDLSEVKLTIDASEYIYVGSMNNNLADGYGKVFMKDYSDLWIALAEGKFSNGMFIEGVLYDDVGIPTYLGEFNYELSFVNGVYYQYDYDGNIYPLLDGTFDQSFGSPDVQWLEFKRLTFGIIYDEEGLFKSYGESAYSQYSDGSYLEAGFKVDGFGGAIYYIGEYVDGEAEGYGVSYYDYSDNRIEYEGNWLNGQYHGEGILYHDDGTVKYQGEFANGDIK